MSDLFVTQGILKREFAVRKSLHARQGVLFIQFQVQLHGI